MVTTHETKKKLRRRSPDEIVADLEAKIAKVKSRAEAKKAKATPEGAALVAAIRGIDKASRVATEAGSDDVVRALESARATLAPALVGLGLRMPEPRGPRKRRAKASEAA